MQSFNLKFYLFYKLLNSLFAGVALGSIFVIYAPLPQITYSLGGIILALGAWILTFFYAKILASKPYKKILIFIEIIPFFYVLAYLFFPTSFYGALFVYVMYQITFIFGGYLVRCETLIFHTTSLIKALDIQKQIGYLLGLGISFLFYFCLEHFLIKEQKEQVYFLHFLLLFLQGLTFASLLFSLKKGKKCKAMS